MDYKRKKEIQDFKLGAEKIAKRPFSKVYDYELMYSPPPKKLSKVLILQRGAPGAGKSLLSAALYAHASKTSTWHETDFYRDGYDQTQNASLHQLCQDDVEKSMQQGFPLVIVSNTFTKDEYLAPYYELAQKYGYLVFSVVVENRHEGKSEHDVPSETLERYKHELANSIKL